MSKLMKLTFCAVCGSTEDLHHHHFTPKILGGLDEETNLITLCYKHHKEIHGNLSEYSTKVNHSKLTKAGLQRAKERGVVLGGTRKGQERGREVRKQQADHKAEKLRTLVEPMVQAGMTLRQIGSNLETVGIPTSRGSSTWTATAVKRLLTRLELK